MKEQGKEKRAHEGCLWLSEARKDATSCDKPRRGANTLRPADLRMGQPGAGDCATTARVGRTRGTETSKYPEEEKTNVIARVVASESAGAQTGAVKAAAGVVGPAIKEVRTLGEAPWKGAPERVRGPYPKARTLASGHLSSAEHEELCAKLRGPSRKAKHYRETDSEPVP